MIVVNKEYNHDEKGSDDDNDDDDGDDNDGDDDDDDDDYDDELSRFLLDKVPCMKSKVVFGL